MDKLPQVSVQVFQYPVLVLNCLKNGLHHVRTVTVAMWRVRTYTSTNPFDHPSTIIWHIIASCYLQPCRQITWGTCVAHLLSESFSTSSQPTYLSYNYIVLIVRRIFRFPSSAIRSEQKTGAPTAHVYSLKCGMICTNFCI